jgi:hypothetical protein
MCLSAWVRSNLRFEVCISILGPFLSLNAVSEYNPQIFIREEGFWETYGRFDAAIGDITLLKWDQLDTGQMVLSVVTVCCIWYLSGVLLTVVIG